MATKKVKVCDECGGQGLDGTPVLRWPYVKTRGKNRELCYGCASKALRDLYGVKVEENHRQIVVAASAEAGPAPVSVVTAEATPAQIQDKRRNELIAENGGVQIFIVTPKEEVAKGMVIKYGPVGSPREIEILEPNPFGDGSWFAKLAG